MAGGDAAVVRAVLRCGGGTFCEEAGFALRDRPQPLFRLLLLSHLLSARITASIAVKAARGLHAAGWRDADTLKASSWDDRVRVLNEAGYTRYQERTATMLADVAELLAERWKGDLRNLREEAECEARRERKLLQEFKGIGTAGADIFSREVQAVWAEHRPFFDKRATAGARRLGIATASMPDHASGNELAPLAAGLVRVELDADVRAAVRDAVRS